MNTSTSRKMKTSAAIALLVSLMIIFVRMPQPAEAKTVPHDPYDHAKSSRITQEFGSNTVYIQCEWGDDTSTTANDTCQFHEWPLLVLERPDAYYDGTPKEADFYVRPMNDYPNGKTTQGFPHDFAEWDGTFTYTGINGTVEYGPTNEAPIGEGTYYVYATVRIPSAVTVLSDATFILGKTFTIEPSSYKVKFDANVPNSASTELNPLTSMPEIYFKSRVETQPLPPNQFDLPGYKFDHWNTKEDDSGVRYENNASVKGLSYGGKDVTLYAQWKPKTYEITYDPGDASGNAVTRQAVFDTPGTLKPVSEMGWTYENHRFLGWKVEGSPLLLDDEEDFVNLCGKITAYDGNPDNVTLTEQWVENGQIVAVVTKDGEPQAGLESGFSLKSSDGTIFTMPVTYEDDTYVFDPSQAATLGGSPSALPEGEYDLYFKIKRIEDLPGIPGSPGYPETSAHITYGGTSAASAVFDYYTVSMVKEPDSSGVREIMMNNISGASMGSVPGKLFAYALDGAKIQLQTNIRRGYHFDGYSAVGVAPSWDEDGPMKATQVITVHGQATIMAHSAANTYAVRFDANTDAAVIGTMDAQDMVYGEPQNLFANQFIRANANFTGWNTASDGSGDAYTDGQSVENLTAEDGEVVTLYAQWEETPIKTATLTFDLAGGKLDGKTGSITVSVNVGDVVEIPVAPTREGYAFKYWKGSEYHPGDKYTVKDDHTFTAVWKKNSNGNNNNNKNKKKAANSSGTTKGSLPSTGDPFNTTVVALITATGCALCLVAIVVHQNRRRSLK